MRNRRLASYEEGSFCHAFLPQFVKFVKNGTDVLADITNLMGRIEKKVLVFVVSEGQGPGGDFGEGVKDPRGRKDPSVFRGNRMCLDEAEEVCLTAAGVYVLYEWNIHYMWYIYHIYAHSYHPFKYYHLISILFECHVLLSVYSTERFLLPLVDLTGHLCNFFQLFFCSPQSCKISLLIHSKFPI